LQSLKTHLLHLRRIEIASPATLPAETTALATLAAKSTTSAATTTAKSTAAAAAVIILGEDRHGQNAH
jgi:hypothetical protein